MEDIEALKTTETTGSEFAPHVLWYLGLDTYSAAVKLEWRSPAVAETWVELKSYTSTGRWQLHAAPGDVFRLTTATAGSRAWVQI